MEISDKTQLNTVIVIIVLIDCYNDDYYKFSNTDIHTQINVTPIITSIV